MTIRTAHFGLGPIGQNVLAMLRQRSWAEVAGAVDVAPDKIGTDAGGLSGGDALGVDVRPSLAAVGAPGAADVVVHCAGSHLRDVESQIIEALEWGASVVSTCEELAYPWYHNPESARRIDEAARAAGRTVLATGVNPGFAMDAMALYTSGACERVDGVRIDRVVDAGTRRGPLQKKVGAGISVDEFVARRAAGRIGHVGLVESVAMLAAAFGWPLEAIDESLEPVMAERAIVTDHADVAAGSVAGIRQVAQGRSGGEARIRLQLDMYVGTPNPGDTIRLLGSPNVTTTINGLHGDVCTAAMVVNGVGALPSLASGLLTMLDVAPVRQRA